MKDEHLFEVDIVVKNIKYEELLFLQCDYPLTRRWKSVIVKNILQMWIRDMCWGTGWQSLQ